METFLGLGGLSGRDNAQDPIMSASLKMNYHQHT